MDISSRQLIYDTKLIAELTKLANKAKYILQSVQDNFYFLRPVYWMVKTTSNKKALNWTKSITPNVIWIDRVRWVKRW